MFKTTFLFIEKKDFVVKGLFCHHEFQYLFSGALYSKCETKNVVLLWNSLLFRSLVYNNMMKLFTKQTISANINLHWELLSFVYFLVNQHASAASLPLGGIIVAKLACMPPIVSNLSLYEHRPIL